ncbi:hypothetical protein MTDSW087_02813 [Methylobacterium dankookense]|uniref:Uncharacterized protein n=2 Tax=Methylobacterium dankookense TaxID=560405 RepID=A0A564FY80_9HYPH|nr:hypothetical protein IFDJLNFL_2574 [Methylobacterium dankookense]VUF13115.1 hypothetical protein MTDSW087_02813 [Methylobacterium dankookense]
MEALGHLFAPLFESGRIADAILLLVAAEALLVALLPGRLGPRAPLLAGLAAGAGLLLALRATLVGAPWPWIAAALAAAFAAHLTEMGLRRAEALRRREPVATSPEPPALPAHAPPHPGPHPGPAARAPGRVAPLRHRGRHRA